MTTPEILTDAMIDTLHAEANTAGDAALVATCKAAKDGHYGPRVDCAAAITAARASASEPHVPVTADDDSDEDWDDEMEDEMREAAGLNLPY